MSKKRLNPLTCPKLQLAFDLLISYTPTSKIYAAFDTQFGLKPKTVDKFLGRARAMWAETDACSIEEKRNMVTKTLQDLYYKASDAKQYAVCARVIEELAKINSLYPDGEKATQRDPIVIHFAEQCVKPEKESTNL